MAPYRLRWSLTRQPRYSGQTWSSWRRVTCHILVFVHVQVTCSFLLTLTFVLTPTLGAPADNAMGPPPGKNLSKMALTLADSSGSSSSTKNNPNSSVNNNLTGGQKLLNLRPLDPPSSLSSGVLNDNSKNTTSGGNVLNGRAKTNATSENANSKNKDDGSRNEALVGSSGGTNNIITHKDDKKTKNGSGVKRTVVSGPSHHPSEGHGIPREFPVALVTAASVAAFCILLFFLLAYIWHTRQLDSRARKLAIRLAADAEDGRRALGRSASACRNCGPGGGRLTSSSSSGRYTLAPPLVAPDSASSSHDHGQYEPLTCTSASSGGMILGAEGESDRIIGPDSISGRSSVGVSESEAGDCEDVFEPATTLPVIPPDRLRGLRSSGRGSHRKWSRSRKSGSGSASFEKRDSAVTDKEILTHFASRRHSTFFI